ncbi:hypothetical protein AURDEDRAFT_176140 [Auricularia subglabra TFB-10046 SS5]|uniref:Uncharacterized protein n=1 Tax=Auricularia subglabra (strain TFB-10046 / SS5) TaxID=717982 RepID=J0WRY9_AURST|nr:hypothetical protein AURDEDRAFT_176140 [Auricularia subglabra TFB-10046 SS5]
MGRSAKVHKRVSKTSAKSHPSAADAATAAQDPKTKSKQAPAPSKEKQRKARAALEDLRHGKDGPVLAGVDYLSLAHGGRRKARQEEEKMKHLKLEGDASLNAEKMGGLKL